MSEGQTVPEDCRFVVDGATGVYENLALEESMLRQNAGLTVRLWTNERSVIIGRAQLARYETDVEHCARSRIPVVRRITAGGTVYHGPGNINWSLFVGREFSRGGLRYVWGVGEVFGMAASLVTEAAARCGVKTWLDAPNRILSEEGKVSGMAAYVSREGLLCHGTFLLDADLREARFLTEPTRVALARKYTRSRSMTMANTGIKLASFIAAFKDVANEKIGGETEVAEPRDSEKEMMRELLSKYRDPAWSMGDPFEMVAGR